MIKKLRRKFKEISKILRITERNNLELRKAEGYNVLSNIRFNNIYIPFNAYSLNADTIVDILNDIILYKRKSIVEFGCGIGTIYIAKLIQMHDLDIKFVSIDSDQEWINTLKDMLIKEDLLQYVELVQADILETKEYVHKTQNKWYDNTVINEVGKRLNKIDMIIVDGPYGPICDYARFSALPILKEFLDEKYCVLLDDTNREVEQDIFKEWENTLGVTGTFHDSYSKIVKDKKFITEL